MKAPSLSAVREMLRETAPGITIRKEDCGEYRVTFTQEAIAAAFPAMTRAERIEKAEALASYDSDICAAYETGKAMFRTGLQPLPQPGTVPDYDAAWSKDEGWQKSAPRMTDAERLERIAGILGADWQGDSLCLQHMVANALAVAKGEAR